MDGQLGLAAVCEIGEDVSVLLISTSSPGEIIVTLPLPATDSVSVTASRIVYADNALGDCQGIVKADGDDISWLKPTSDDDWATVSLDTQGDAPCDSVPAGNLSVSASGGNYAYFVAPDVDQGRLRRMAASASLYYGPVGSPARALMHDIDRPVDLSISADGKMVALSAELAADNGIWALDVESGERLLVARDMFGDIAISPDGRRLAVTRAAEGHAGHELVFIALRP